MSRDCTAPTSPASGGSELLGGRFGAFARALMLGATFSALAGCGFTPLNFVDVSLPPTVIVDGDADDLDGALRAAVKSAGAAEGAAGAWSLRVLELSESKESLSVSSTARDIEFRLGLRARYELRAPDGATSRGAVDVRRHMRQTLTGLDAAARLEEFLRDDMREQMTLELLRRVAAAAKR